MQCRHNLGGQSPLGIEQEQQCKFPCITLCKYASSSNTWAGYSSVFNLDSPLFGWFVPCLVLRQNRTWFCPVSDGDAILKRPCWPGVEERSLQNGILSVWRDLVHTVDVKAGQRGQGGAGGAGLRHSQQYQHAQYSGNVSADTLAIHTGAERAFQSPCPHAALVL